MTQNLIGSAICDGVNTTPPKISIVQIWNPVDSGVNLFVTHIEVAWNATDARIAELKGMNGFDFDFNYAVLGSVISGMIDVDASNQVNSPIELRGVQVASPYPPCRIFFEKWPGPRRPPATAAGPGPLTSVDTPFEPALKLPPGCGILVRPAQPFTWNIVNAQGYSQPAGA